MAEREHIRVDSGTRAVGVIGWPVDHSLSPVIHNAAFGALGLNWVYVPMPVEPGELPAAVEGLRALGSAGANVTMPHKSESAALADTLSEDAARLRAVNTFVIGSAGIEGHNTDAPGFARFLDRDAGFDPAGKSALIFGAGGAARACALALARAGLAMVTVAARDPARAEGVAEALDGFATKVAATPFEASGRFDLVVNATPLGAAGEDLPLPELMEGTLVVDLLYRPTITPLQVAARHAGASAFGGLGLLLHQAALSFELWTGRQPPMSAMSAAALSELA